jgi:hypothetical protein
MDQLLEPGTKGAGMPTFSNPSFTRKIPDENEGVELFLVGLTARITVGDKSLRLIDGYNR